MESNKIISGIQEAGHTLVCLSSSPSNAKIVRAAAKMAASFGGNFTALFVVTSSFENMSEENKKRLQKHIRLAESLGADIATAYGDDISYQIAEFARLSGITEIVIGRSSTKRRHFWDEPTLTEKLIEIAPNLDIHIIPDNAPETNYREKRYFFTRMTLPSLKDILITAGLLTISTFIGVLFHQAGITEVNTIAIYILGVLLTSLITSGHICGVASSFFSVILFNYFLTEPLYTFHAYDPGVPVTFAIMLVTSIITGTLTSELKNRAKLSAQSSFRTKVLFDTSKLLQKEREDIEIIKIAANQLCVLLDRNVIAYPDLAGHLSDGYIFTAATTPDDTIFFSPLEKQAAEWTSKNKKRAGATTDVLQHANCLYLSIRNNGTNYGVVGIHIQGRPLDSFENSVIISILGECALAIENSRNTKEKQQADLLAKNEQLRANLLRSISHDLRTPLTSISGNASNLLSSYQNLDEETRLQMFTDIYDDSQWLINLVENLLSITRIEEGKMNIHISDQLIDEIIDEALQHISRKSTEHEITVEYKSDLLLVKVDARLIIQVIINLVNNAIKYTPAGSKIHISAEKKDDFVLIQVSDDGDGISDADKKNVFEMFYTGNSSIADSQRSLGLGLPLCRSIIHAHNGELILTDNLPHGSVFSFTLPCGEVIIHE